MNLLIRRFIKDYEQTDNPAVRTAYGQFSSYVGIMGNAFLFVLKLVIGSVTNSVAIMADAFNNLSDASASIISLLGFKLASKPADKEHPYGHGRYEYLAGLMVAVFVLVIGVEMARTSLEKILHPEPIAFAWLPMAILLVSIVVKVLLMRMNMDIGQRISSTTLLATAMDSRNDILTTAMIVLTTFISHYAGWDLDGWAGFAVAAFIIVGGAGMVRDTLDPILGSAPDPEWMGRIRAKVISYPGVLGTHDLIIHDYGPGRQFASVHVEMAAEADVIANHETLDIMEQDFWLEEGLHLVTHFDPILTQDEATGTMRAWLAQEVLHIDPSLTVHDVRIVPGVTQTKLVFDCVAPFSLPMTDKALREAIAERVCRAQPDYICVIVIDREYTVD